METENFVLVGRILYNNETCSMDIPDFEVTRGDLVVIETPNGPEIVNISGHSCASPPESKRSKIKRKCTEQDLETHEANKQKEQKAFDITVEKIKKHNLEMKLVSVHYFLDNNKIIFNFTADGRVDFRELVKDLASVFKKRIELRQIGARDEAKIVSGYGVCGREFCCNAIKHELQPVTIKMAKVQNLTLNSTKISGACGRLLCCLAYEHEAYCSLKRSYPQEGSVLRYNGKTVTLCEINVLKKTATLRSEDHLHQVISLEELAKAERRGRKQKQSGGGQDAKKQDAKSGRSHKNTRDAKGSQDSNTSEKKAEQNSSIT